MPEPSSQKAERIQQLERRLKLEPMSRIFLELARELHEAGQFEEAARVCSGGLKIHTTWRSARALLGRIYFDMGRLDEAREQLEDVVTHAPENLVARRILADICAEEGDYDGALERYRALLAFSPGDPEVARRIGELENERAARPAATPMSGADPLATPTLAALYAEQGHTRKAIAVYREVLRADPGNEEARVRLDLLSAGPAPAPSAPSPGEVVRRRKIKALNDWLAAIRGGARA